MNQFEADESVVPPQERVLAAVSSGADSMALLWWLRSLGRDFVVGHVHHDLHELRNGDCDRDEEFVRNRCAELGIAFVSKKIELPRKNGHVNEVVARDGRYAALIEMARENGCARIATAHTATDGLETALLNLLRGAGAGGWLGIAPERVLEDEIFLVRPFWKLPRLTTREVLRQNGWEWREDPSNTDPHFRRNRMRHEVLPLLADLAGREVDQLAVQHARNARVGRDESLFLDALAQKTLLELVMKRDVDLIALDGLRFRELDVAMQRRVLRAAAQTICPEVRDLALEKIEKTRLAVALGVKRIVWTWRSDLRVEWTGSGAGNRLRFWRVKTSAHTTKLK